MDNARKGDGSKTARMTGGTGRRPPPNGKGQKNMTVTKDTLIGDILDTDRTTASYFLEMGMHCLAAPPPAAKRWSRPVRFMAWTAKSW